MLKWGTCCTKFLPTKMDSKGKQSTYKLNTSGIIKSISCTNNYLQKLPCLRQFRLHTLHVRHSQLTFSNTCKDSKKTENSRQYAGMKIHSKEKKYRAKEPEWWTKIRVKRRQHIITVHTTWTTDHTFYSTHKKIVIIIYHYSQYYPLLLPRTCSKLLLILGTSTLTPTLFILSLM